MRIWNARFIALEQGEDEEVDDNRDHAESNGSEESDTKSKGRKDSLLGEIRAKKEEEHIKKGEKRFYPEYDAWMYRTVWVTDNAIDALEACKENKGPSKKRLASEEIPKPKKPHYH